MPVLGLGLDLVFSVVCLWGYGESWDSVLMFGLALGLGFDLWLGVTEGEGKAELLG